METTSITKQRHLGFVLLQAEGVLICAKVQTEIAVLRDYLDIMGP